MIIVCAGCRARFRVADEKIGPRGAKVRCGKCGNVFAVRRDGEAATAGAAAPAPASPRAQTAIPALREAAPVRKAAPPALELDLEPRRSPFALADDPFAAVRGSRGAPDLDAGPAPAELEAAGLGAPFVAAVVPRGLAAPSSPPVADLSDLLGAASLAAPGPEPEPEPEPEPRPEPGFAPALDALPAPLAAEDAPFAPPSFDELALDGPDPAAAPAGRLELDFGGFPVGAGFESGLELDRDPRVFDAALQERSGFAPLDFGPERTATRDLFAEHRMEVATPSPLAPPVPPAPETPEPLAPRAPFVPAAREKAVPLAPEPDPEPEAPVETPDPVGPPRSPLRALALNAVSLAALLVVVGALLVLWRGGGSLTAALRRTPALAGLVGGGVAEATFAVHDVSSGLFDRADGAPILYVRGSVASHAPGSVGPLRVAVEILRGEVVVARGEALAGALPTPEELYRIKDAADLTRRAEAWRSRAPGEVAAGATLPFLVAILDFPSDLTGTAVRVEAAVATH